LEPPIFAHPVHLTARWTGTANEETGYSRMLAGRPLVATEAPGTLLTGRFTRGSPGCAVGDLRRSHDQPKDN
jgi:hypothetical protein